MKPHESVHETQNDTRTDEREVRKIYTGKSPYIFISYSHRDKESVLPYIRYLIERGYRVWYDHEISSSTDWLTRISYRLSESYVFMPFFSPNYLASEHCMWELEAASNFDKVLIPVYLHPASFDAHRKLYDSYVERMQARYCERSIGDFRTLKSPEELWRELKYKDKPMRRCRRISMVGRVLLSLLVCAGLVAGGIGGMNWIMQSRGTISPGGGGGEFDSTSENETGFEAESELESESESEEKFVVLNTVTVDFSKYYSEENLLDLKNSDFSHIMYDKLTGEFHLKGAYNEENITKYVFRGLYQTQNGSGDTSHTVLKDFCVQIDAEHDIEIVLENVAWQAPEGKSAIYLPANKAAAQKEITVTLNVIGKNLLKGHDGANATANGVAGGDGTAGIDFSAPANATLNLVGAGTLDVHGGNGGNGADGATATSVGANGNNGSRGGKGGNAIIASKVEAGSVALRMFGGFGGDGGRGSDGATGAEGKTYVHILDGGKDGQKNYGKTGGRGGNGGDGGAPGLALVGQLIISTETSLSQTDGQYGLGGDAGRGGDGGKGGNYYNSLGSVWQCQGGSGGMGGTGGSGREAGKGGAGGAVGPRGTGSPVNGIGLGINYGSTFYDDQNAQSGKAGADGSVLVVGTEG